MDTAEHARDRAAWWFTCGLFFVLSLLTTVPWLHHIGGWLDEGATMSAASRSIADLVTLSTHHDAVLGTYYATVHSWLAVAGPSLTSARALSAVCLAAATVAVLDCGRAVGGRVVGCVAGAQLLVIPGVSWAGLDARPTALATLLLAVQLRLLLRARGRVPGPWFYVVSVIAGWVQLTTILQLVCTINRSTVRRVRLWASTGLAVLCVIPVAWAGHRQSAQIGWIDDGPVAQLTSVFVGRFADAPKSTTFLTGPVGVTSAVLGVVYLALCIAAVWRLRSPEARLLAGWAFAPAVLAVLAGPLTGGTVYLARYFAASLPAAFLLVGLLARDVWSVARVRHAGCVVAAALVVALCLPSLAASRVADGKWGEDSRQVAAEVGASDAPVIWLGDSLSVAMTYPQLVGDTAQLPTRASALRSDWLWGRRSTTGRAVQRARQLHRAVIVTPTRDSAAVRRALHRAGCAATHVQPHRRYTVLAVSCGR
ncbi:hypothetical protein [Flexivirga oryzae]|uniref:Mannosyltransferase n=1 Tax=Flexivirga oryzae TaxID=1794944 RepID=A0A839N7D5_9MICO|nr:hypothetical protein [Flexivirga oryzae]MBB2893670.1 mannosyltransferase [Flexivirga oryzae]